MLTDNLRSSEGECPTFWFRKTIKNLPTKIKHAKWLTLVLIRSKLRPPSGNPMRMGSQYDD